MAANNLLLGILVEELSRTSRFIQNNARISTDIITTSFVASEIVLLTPEQPTRVEGYSEETVPLYTDVTFQMHFRMQRTTFEELCTNLAPHMPRERAMMTVEKRVLSTLWLLGNQESYRSVADRFGISKGTLHHTVISTVKAILLMMSEWISFTNNRHALNLSADGFKARCGLPGVVGAIDGTHIPIPAPTSVHRSSFINRKGYSSMILQVVCDNKLKFLDIYTGWPGSVHDARVYRNSPISQLIKDLPDEYHLLGDSAYPLSAGLLTPYRDNGHLDCMQKKFNKAHSSTRVDVERAIGLLKCKFRRLKFLDMLLQEEIPEVISACCVLHNFILCKETVNLEESEIAIEDDIGLFAPDHMAENDRNSMYGEEKRRTIANTL